MLIPSQTHTILFSGLAPVHFACFRPLYERLVTLPDVEVFLSGGIRTRTETEVLYDTQRMYHPFGVENGRILTTEEIQHRDFDMQFGANTKMVSPRSAATRIQIFHGISFRNKAIRQENMGCDFYFLVGPYMHRRFLEANLLKENDPRALRIGFSKTDRLINGTLDREKLLQQFGLDGSRPVILYAPTGQKNNSLETMGEEVIQRLVESGRYDLLIKPHDHPKNKSLDWFAQLARWENAHTHVSREADVIPLLFVADLLITDASSVSSEYALLDRPMVFLDVPKLLMKAMGANESMLDMDTWGRRGGVIVKRPEDVLAAVADGLSDPTRYSEVRQAMTADLFYNPGHATEAALHWIRRRLARTTPSETLRSGT